MTPTAPPASPKLARTGFICRLSNARTVAETQAARLRAADARADTIHAVASVALVVWLAYAKHGL